MFETEENKHPGNVRAGVFKTIKDTTDYVINFNCDKWGHVYDMLKNELRYNLKKYVDFLNTNEDYKSNANHSTAPDHLVLNEKGLSCDLFMMQRYMQGKGRYIYHDDFRIDPDNSSFRVVTFLWYLNDVIDGGETVFEGTYAIKPETGKLILFPASWTYTHCGKMPISSNKYIITGWIYYK
jgi:hypothetical protein